jgi:hypothetical protein
MIPSQKKSSSGNGPVSLLRRLSTRDRSKKEPQAEGRTSTLIQKSVSMRAKSLGHARRESIQARRAQRQADAQNPKVKEETDAELGLRLGGLEEEGAGEREREREREGGETSGGSHERLEPEDPDLAKPVYLKGIFSVSTTSTRPLPMIRADIKRVLKMLGVDFTEIKGGFSCSHVPSIAPAAGAVDGEGFGGVVDRHFSPHPHHDARERERVVDGEIRFEIVIVKVPIVSLHGVQFKRVGGNTWQYKAMAEQIVRELRL